MKSFFCTIAIVAVTLLTGCSTSSKKEILEISNQDNRPAWVNGSKISWLEGDQLMFRSQYTVRGDERVNACYALAKLDTDTTLLREIAEDIRGQIDHAQQTISENAETILNQSVTSVFSGRVHGLRFLEQHHERFVVSGTERLECYVLGTIKKSDYDQIRREILQKVTAVDPGLKHALNQRQIDFFNKNQKAENQ